MRWIRFAPGGTGTDALGPYTPGSYGIVEGDRIREVTGDPFTGYEETSRRHDLSAVKVLIPVIPRTFYAAGMNYARHVREIAERQGIAASLPDRAEIGYRANNALIADGEDIVIPHDATEKMHYEGEIVVVIGRRARNVSEAEARTCILGDTIGNDVSERSWQRTDRTFWRCKNADTFKPMGPWLDTGADPQAMETIVRVNGRETIRFQTAEMIFGIATFISVMSRYLTLWPGDVIWMGTDGSSPDLVAGDEVSVELTGLGTLTNRLIAGSPEG